MTVLSLLLWLRPRTLRLPLLEMLLLKLLPPMLLTHMLLLLIMSHLMLPLKKNMNMKLLPLMLLEDISPPKRNTRSMKNKLLTEALLPIKEDFRNVP